MWINELITVSIYNNNFLTKKEDKINKSLLLRTMINLFQYHILELSV